MKVLQIVTLTFLAATIVLYPLLKISTEAHDQLAINTLKISIVGSSLWLTFVVIYLIVHGFGSNPLESILNKVRSLFSIRSFLIISIFLFGVANTFLIYQLVGYRQVEFIADKKVRLYDNPEAGVIAEIGILNSNSPMKFRLKNGDHFIFFDILESGAKGSLERFEVLAFWKKQKMQRIKTDNQYEKL